MKTNKKEQKSKKDEKAPMDAAMTCAVVSKVEMAARGASDRTYRPATSNLLHSNIPHTSRAYL